MRISFCTLLLFMSIFAIGQSVDMDALVDEYNSLNILYNFTSDQEEKVMDVLERKYKDLLKLRH